MKTPFYAIAINDVSEMTFTHVTKAGDTDPLSFGLPLHEFNADGLDASCMRIGQMVFGVMTHWHPAEFARFPNLKIPFNSQGDLDLISDLMSKAVTLKSKAFVPVIDQLITELAGIDPHALTHITIKVWPDIRARLEKHSD